MLAIIVLTDTLKMGEGTSVGTGARTDGTDMLPDWTQSCVSLSSTVKVGKAMLSALPSGEPGCNGKPMYEVTGVTTGVEMGVLPVGM